MPIAYLLGRREFFGLELHVGPAVLIPRPETEGLVEAALERLPAQTAARVLDLGTGSGAVAIAIASERPGARVEAVDIDPAALALASANADRLGVKNVRFCLTDWFSGVDGGKFDLIAGNPPYVDAADPHLAEGDVAFEPRHALTPGPDGLAALRVIVHEAPAHLVNGGWLLLEHGYDQGEAVRALFAAEGFEAVATRPDLAGIGRVTLGQLPVAAAG